MGGEGLAQRRREGNSHGVTGRRGNSISLEMGGLDPSRVTVDVSAPGKGAGIVHKEGVMRSVARVGSMGSPTEEVGRITRSNDEPLQQRDKAARDVDSSAVELEYGEGDDY